jgi:DNA polymerase-2
MSTRTGFILTRQWRDTPEGLELEFWLKTDAGSLKVLVNDQESLFFIESKVDITGPFRKSELELNTLDHEPVSGVYFHKQRALQEEREKLKNSGLTLYESDIKPDDRYLMERFIFSTAQIQGDFKSRSNYTETVNPAASSADYSPALSVLSIDIETEGLAGKLYSIAAYGERGSKVFLNGHDFRTETTESFDGEKRVLKAFFDWLNDYDPDVLIGWNVVDFDLDYIEKKCKALSIPFSIGRGGENASLIRPQTSRQSTIARIPGRIVLDGIQLLRLGFWNFERFSLEHVARELLGIGKKITNPTDRVDEINRMYAEEPEKLAAYNLEDCRLVWEIFLKADLLNFAIERSKLTGLAMDRYGGSVAAFDFQYLPKLHREGFVGHDVGHNSNPITSPGGYVMDSQPGLYTNVLVLDFKSLYPSIIQTFCIDPLGLHLNEKNSLPGFKGANFSRNTHILPGLIQQLWKEREKAKKNDHRSLQLAIKIIMNSFYGVLGSSGCRFYDPKLASSITLRGHELITRSKEFIEAKGYPVIYGDTDSVFVHVKNTSSKEAFIVGTTLAAELNEWWKETLQQELQIVSSLEIEFETLYSQFFMPTIRGSQKGSKKRYAGLAHKEGGEEVLEIKGLEAVRSDWTPLARMFQQEVIQRVFAGSDIKEYVQTITDEVINKEHDSELLYRKRLRKPIEEYVKNVPPHAQAAKQLQNPGRWIEYYITINGPEPIEKLQSPLDYSHYLTRQLAPAVDPILGCLDTNFEKITGKQLEMF